MDKALRLRNPPNIKAKLNAQGGETKTAGNLNNGPVSLKDRISYAQSFVQEDALISKFFTAPAPAAGSLDMAKTMVGDLGAVAPMSLLAQNGVAKTMKLSTVAQLFRSVAQTPIENIQIGKMNEKNPVE